MANKPQPTLDDLAAKLESLTQSFLALQELKERVWLHRKDLMARYNCSQATLHRRIQQGSLPKSFRFAGPLWSLADLERAEAAGRLPRPVSA